MPWRLARTTARRFARGGLLQQPVRSRLHGQSPSRLFASATRAASVSRRAPRRAVPGSTSSQGVPQTRAPGPLEGLGAVRPSFLARVLGRRAGRHRARVRARHAAACCSRRTSPRSLHTAAGSGAEEGPGTLRMVFLSRISPKKNLEQAIRIASQVPGESRLRHLGTRGGSLYTGAVARRPSGSARPTSEVTNRGVMPHERVADTLAGYDAFLLPSLGENFGHAIWEALACGVPVVVSDRTPWRGLAALGVGYDLPLGDPAAFVRALTEYCQDGRGRALATPRKACIEFARRWRAENARLDDVARRPF